MKKRFPVSDLCCANCAAKMEDAIRKLDGVNAVTVSVLTEKLTEKGFHCTSIPDEREAYTTAVNGCYDVVLFIGSIYLIGDMRILYQMKGW